MLTPQTMNKLAIIAAYGLCVAVGLSFVMLGLIAIFRDGAATAQVTTIAGNMAQIFGGFLGAMGIVNTVGNFFGRQQSPAGQAVAATVASAPAVVDSTLASEGPSNG